MNITVIVCTYNRCESLRKALDSIVASKVHNSVQWEVLVVDNNSTDRTVEVVTDLSGRYPGRFRYIAEPQQGLCNARNAGIREARGKILVFVDDDVTVESTWLDNLTRRLSEGQYGAAGGRILAERAFVVPRWVPLTERHPWGPLALFDLGPEAGPSNEPPFGANMAFRKDLFDKYGYFRTDLDRCGKGMLSNGDTEFGHRLLNAGERLYYEPSATVYHPVPEHRLQKRYFLAWWFGKGRSDMRQFGIRPGTKYFFAKVPIYLFPRLFLWIVKWITAVRPAVRFQCKTYVWWNIGGLLECYQGSLNPTSLEPIRKSGAAILRA